MILSPSCRYNKYTWCMWKSSLRLGEQRGAPHLVAVIKDLMFVSQVIIICYKFYMLLVHVIYPETAVDLTSRHDKYENHLCDSTPNVVLYILLLLSRTCYYFAGYECLLEVLHASISNAWSLRIGEYLRCRGGTCEHHLCEWVTNVGRYIFNCFQGLDICFAGYERLLQVIHASTVPYISLSSAPPKVARPAGLPNCAAVASAGSCVFSVIKLWLFLLQCHEVSLL